MKKLSIFILGLTCLFSMSTLTAAYEMPYQGPLEESVSTSPLKEKKHDKKKHKRDKKNHKHDQKEENRSRENARQEEANDDWDNCNDSCGSCYEDWYARDLTVSIPLINIDLPGYQKTPDVAQYKGADWENVIGLAKGLSLKEAETIANSNPVITYFFFMKGSFMFLENEEGYRSFEHGDAVFFTGTPWWGSAPGMADGYVKTAEHPDGQILPVEDEGRILPIED